MHYVKRIVCLANSWRNSGRCIAGKEILASGYGAWVRPVSARATAEISDEERALAEGGDPRILDIVDVALAAPRPEPPQTENHLIDAGYYWEWKGRLPWPEVKRLVDQPNELWPNKQSTSHGLNDRVSADLACQLTTSLALIEPEALTIRLQTEGADSGGPKRRPRAVLQYRGVPYNLAVTDPVTWRAFHRRPDGDYPLEGAFLSISLGEEFTDGYCYKLVAAIIRKGLYA